MKEIDARLKYSIDLHDGHQEAQFKKMPSAHGTKYLHKVHGICEILQTRPILDNYGRPLPEAYKEVKLVGKETSFWTGACYLDTMDLLDD